MPGSWRPSWCLGPGALASDTETDTHCSFHTPVCCHHIYSMTGTTLCKLWYRLWRGRARSRATLGCRWVWCPGRCLLALPALKLVLVSDHGGDGWRKWLGMSYPFCSSVTEGIQCWHLCKSVGQSAYAVWDVEVHLSSTALRDSLGFSVCFRTSSSSLVPPQQSWAVSLWEA